MTVPGSPSILADRLRTAGLSPADVLVHRIVLDPADRDEEYRSTADLARTGHVLVYERIQDGAVFGQKALVAGFVETSDGNVRFAGLRRVVARRPGSAPGDIIYDPEIAHLLHNFITRAKDPTFYDAAEDERGPSLEGTGLHWPGDGQDIRRGDDPALILIEEQA